jgi:hypothetical protein
MAVHSEGKAGYCYPATTADSGHLDRPGFARQAPITSVNRIATK